MSHTTLIEAHRMITMHERGISNKQIAEELGVHRNTVSNVICGNYMLQQRALADRMEAFLGGVIIGDGNVRFHAASPSGDNDDGHVPSKAHHHINASYEDGRIVPVTADVLTELLAQEDLIDRITEAGIDPASLILKDTGDTDNSTQLGGTREHRDVAVHEETYEQFLERTKGKSNFMLAHEGEEVDVWSVRKNPEDTGLWGTPWVHPNERG